MNNEEQLKRALELIVWYNGLSPVLKEWLELEPDKTSRIIKEPYFDKDYNEHDKSQIQIMWMFCVILFGDYGTSPRYGWIEKIDEFKDFIRSLISEEDEDGTD